jgi:hypothetical protein
MTSAKKHKPRSIEPAPSGRQLDPETARWPEAANGSIAGMRSALAAKPDAAGVASTAAPSIDAATDLPAPPKRSILDPSVVAFVEALARYAARRDHEDQFNETPENPN